MSFTIRCIDKPIKLLFLFCFFNVISYPSFACKCPAIEPINKNICNQYNVIFYGKVDSVNNCPSNGISTAFFTILNLYKGAVTQNVKIDFDCASECLMSFGKEENWIIYASYQKFDLLTVSICEHSRKKFENRKDDYFELNAKRSFEEELLFLNEALGNKEFAKVNDLNQIQNTFKPRNDQPSGANKLILLIISLLSMLLVGYYIKTKKKE